MILYILIQSARSMKLFVKMSLNETHGSPEKQTFVWYISYSE
jgi:hypothetical protein